MRILGLKPLAFLNHIEVFTTRCCATGTDIFFLVSPTTLFTFRFLLVLIITDGHFEPFDFELVLRQTHVSLHAFLMQEVFHFVKESHDLESHFLGQVFVFCQAFCALSEYVQGVRGRWQLHRWGNVVARAQNEVCSRCGVVCHVVLVMKRFFFHIPTSATHLCALKL
jgi:hypothetical protein